MNEIDPIHFGKLTAQVEQLEKTVDKMAIQIETLMGLVNQGRGVFWVAIILGGAISSVTTFVVSKIQLFAGFMR